MSNQPPSLSIVMPVFNGESHISECLKSIIAQSFTDFECIVVNDGSTDATLEIINALNEPRITVIDTDHVGSSHARNVGSEKSRGEFIIFLDADDFFHRDMLSGLYNKIIESDSDIAICNYRKFDTVAKSYSEKILTDKDLPHTTFKANTIPEKIFNIFSGVPWNKLYRKSFLQRNEIIFAEDLVIGADSLFVHESLLKAKQIIYIERNFISYRVNNPNSDVARASKFLPDIASTIDKLYAVLTRQQDHDRFLQSFDNWSMGKCMWIYQLNGGVFDDSLTSIFQKYKLAEHTDSYYFDTKSKELISRFKHFLKTKLV